MNSLSRVFGAFSKKIYPARMTMTSSYSSSLFTFPDGKRMRVPPLPAEISDRYKIGQMYRYQDTIPPLPVNPLEQTLNKYLQAMEPIVSSKEFEKTQQIVEEFKKPGGVGERLQKMLQDRAKTHDNWLIDWWNHFAYLAFRESVVINVTPAIAFPIQNCSTRQLHVETATKITMGMLKVFQLVQIEALPPDVYRDKPYCMWQYARLYGCRIPGKNVDTFSQSSLPNNRHIIVMRKGHVYKLTLYYDTPDGEIVLAPPSFIMEQIHWILDDATERPHHPVGVLTTLHRDKWFQARERLLKDPINKASIEDIQTCILTICLDEAKPDVSNYHKNADSSLGLYEGIISTRTLHGNGTDCNTINRWFDCTAQILIGEDGGCGSILEHSPLDGPAGMFSSKFSLDLMTEYNYDFFGEQSSPLINKSLFKSAERLKWNISEETVLDVQEACQDINKSIKNVDFHVMNFNDFGKSLPKQFQLSPDGFIQMAIQLAYYKLYGKSTATYESGGIRWFKYGRTDTIRSSTNASNTFVKAMMDPMESTTRKVELFINAIKAHSQYTVDAISGKAFDRHLLGLKILASTAGIPTPAFFNDTTFQKSVHFHLSTSQVPVPNHDIFLSFGAVVPDGYGVCYNPQNKKLLVSISSYHDCPETDSKLFAAILAESFRDLRDILTTASIPSAKL